MRIPYELLTELANSLLNETVFEIVKGLMEIQVNAGSGFIRSLVLLETQYRF